FTLPKRVDGYDQLGQCSLELRRSCPTRRSSDLTVAGPRPSPHRGYRAARRWSCPRNARATGDGPAGTAPRPRPFPRPSPPGSSRSEEHTSELQSRVDLVCRLPLEKQNERREGTL